MALIRSSKGAAMRLGLVMPLMILLSACAARYTNHGYIPPQEQLDEITVGIDTKDSVAETVGVPSAGGVLNDGGYYYVRSRVRTFGPMAPKVIERQVLAISFDQTGVVTNIERFGLERGNVVPLSRRVTQPGVRDNTFLRQLLGNIGRFSPGALAN